MSSPSLIDENKISPARQPSSTLTTCESCTKFFSDPSETGSSRGTYYYSTGTKDFTVLEWADDPCSMCVLLRDAILSLFPDVEEKLEYVRIAYSWSHVRRQDGENINSPFLVVGLANWCDAFPPLREKSDTESDDGSEDAEELKECVRFEFEIFALEGKSCPWPGMGYSKIAPGNTLSEASFLQVQRWLQNCEQNHSCKKNPESRLPTRVIELRVIEGRETPVVQLIEGCGVMARYACLSHCWGDGSILRTTQETLSAHQSGIAWNTLPRTFGDAFQYCLRLGIKYIWVDSLCIIQDDIEDWRKEAAQMSSIYEGAYITIAATGSANSEDGLQSSSETQDASVLYQIGPDGLYKIGVRRRIPHQFDFAEDLGRGSWQAYASVEEDFPLLTRAWVFQERLLSPRVLHFGVRELTWECNEAVDCECSGIGFDDDRVHPKLDHRRACLVSSGQESHFTYYWYRRVHEYTRLNMTLEKDVFPAFSGIAKQTQGVIQARYVAGLWQDDLIFGLLWETYDPLAGRPKAWRAPTWSWASVRGAVDYNYMVSTFRTYCRDISAEVTPAGEDPYGELEAATLSMEAQIVSGTLRYNFNKVARQKLARRTEATRKLAPTERHPSLAGFSVQHSQYADVSWKFFPDYDLSADGVDQIAPGDTVFCMRMTWTGYVQILLVLRLSPSEPRTFERIGLCRGGKLWSSDADYGFANVEFQRVTII